VKRTELNLSCKSPLSNGNVHVALTEVCKLQCEMSHEFTTKRPSSMHVFVANQYEVGHEADGLDCARVTGSTYSGQFSSVQVL